MNERSEYKRSEITGLPSWATHVISQDYYHELTRESYRLGRIMKAYLANINLEFRRQMDDEFMDKMVGEIIRLIETTEVTTK